MNLLSPEDLTASDSKEAVLCLKEAVPRLVGEANLQRAEHGLYFLWLSAEEKAPINLQFNDRFV